MLPVFQRLTSRALDHLGEPARLRGEIVDPPIKVNVEHGVEFAGVYGEVTSTRSVATIDNTYVPEKGDLLEIGTVDATGVFTVVNTYKLDVLVKNNGYSSVHVLREG